MNVTWYPKNIARGVILLAILGLALKVSADVGRGAEVAFWAVVVYAIVDVMFSVNPAVWQRRGRAARQ